MISRPRPGPGRPRCEPALSPSFLLFHHWPLPIRPDGPNPAHPSATGRVTRTPTAPSLGLQRDIWTSVSLRHGCDESPEAFPAFALWSRRCPCGCHRCGCQGHGPSDAAHHTALLAPAAPSSAPGSRVVCFPRDSRVCPQASLYQRCLDCTLLLGHH